RNLLIITIYIHTLEFIEKILKYLIKINFEAKALLLLVFSFLKKNY
ncbi:MAG: hypothetical protein ACI8RD_004630, partial [Bacillariaceae sp.]